MSRSAVLITAASMGVPAIVSTVKMPMFYTVLLANSTVWSMMYHSKHEQQFQSLDEFWANLLVFISAIMYNLVFLSYGPTHWRSIAATLLGIVALVMFFTNGYAEKGKTTEDIEHYDLYHSLWHGFASLTILVIVTSDIKMNDVDVTYSQFFKRMFSFNARKYDRLYM